MSLEKEISVTALHGTTHLTFMFPPFKGTFGESVTALDSQELSLPIPYETASFVTDAWEKPDKNQILQLLEDHGLWESMIYARYNGIRLVFGGNFSENHVGYTYGIQKNGKAT